MTTTKPTIPTDLTSASTTAGGSSSHEEPLPQPDPLDEPPQYDSDQEAPLFDTTDPLYDEHADSEDEAWVQEHLLNTHPETSDDQHVSCPCCFRMLSMQCQAHEKFDGQFRAIAVSNCRVIESEQLFVQEEGRAFSAEERQVFRAVACGNCGTEVAVLDEQDVYHFCNVLY